ncbi:MAG: YfhO family protein, partial [Lachnospiraceae bacterium]|nr:YfhO family protein [Lachnospiraceae bacterium]
MKKKARTWMHNNRIYVLAFAVPAFLMLVVFVMAKIYPFGSRSFLHIDMYHQYFPFLTDLYHAVRGKGAGSEGTGLMYSFNAGLGTNIPALYDYYLSSPFNLLAFLVPERYLMEFFSYLAIIKIGLSGSSFCYYLAKHFDIDVVSKTKAKEGR